MDNLFLDFETKSAINIKKCGAFRYIEDESFDVLLLAYAFDDRPVRVVDFTSGETWPEEFLQALRDPAVTKVAHTAIFERTVIGKLLGYTPPEEWLDTMHLAAQCGLPLSLDAAGKALGLPEDQAKMREGKALIRYFCQPCQAFQDKRRANLESPGTRPGEVVHLPCVLQAGRGDRAHHLPHPGALDAVSRGAPLLVPGRPDQRAGRPH